MSEEQETYCRLCAEPTPKTQMISTDDDVGLNSKIATKMLWINIEISPTNMLPNTICFSCFDLLERTWSFLHEVRAAQQKLQEIFSTKVDVEITSDTVKEDTETVGKPINDDWEDFQDVKKEVKPEILNEDVQIETVDPSALIAIDLDVIKLESHCADDTQHDDTQHSDGFNSTDSDIPLFLSLKHRKKKKKLKNKQSENIPTNNEEYQSWDDYMLRCAECDAQCKNFVSLRLHSLHIHNKCCIFKCSDCGKITSKFSSFINHVRCYHKILRYCCEICNKNFVTVNVLKEHKRFSHWDSLTCENCGAIFDSQELLQDHMTIYSKEYRKRKVKKETELELKCEHCQKEFKTRSSLATHKLVHTERRRDFSCHVCGKMFFTKGSLCTHMATHDETKPFQCDFCPLTFRARGNLQSHISLHSGAKPFVCEQCGKSFRIKRHLKSHSIMHTDLRPYVCEYCNKAFRFKTRLNLHVRQHTGAKPYNCIYCQRDFTNGSNFKKHMKRRHNIDTSSRKKYSNVNNDQSLDAISDVETIPT